MNAPPQNAPPQNAPQINAQNSLLTPRARDGKIQETQGIMVLRCACHNLPFAEIDFARGVLKIVTRHRGQFCENTIPLLDLRARLESAATSGAAISGAATAESSAG